MLLFFFHATATTEIYTLSLHDALPIWLSRATRARCPGGAPPRGGRAPRRWGRRSEEHTSELQSRLHLVCRLLLEKKNKTSREPAPACLPPPSSASSAHPPLSTSWAWTG